VKTIQGMVSYLGLPISWPDGDIFGTFCVLDIKEHKFDERFEIIMRQFRETIEEQLESMWS